jgi:hypothetical protein
MKLASTKLITLGLTLLTLAGTYPPLFAATEAGATTEQTSDAPHDMKVTVKMIGPYAQAADLQIVCAFKHNAAGDTYVGAMKDLDSKLGGLLSSLRNRGEFVGDLGETISILPPAGSIVAKRLLVIGLGPEPQLSLETLEIVGRVALREAIAAKAKHVAFAPVIRDQGNEAIDVGAGDRAFVENMILAYDTEKRLQDQKLAAPFSIKDWTIEAGPTFFAGAAREIQSGIATAGKEIADRSAAPYSTLK